MIIVAVSPDAERLEAALARARETYQNDDTESKPSGVKTVMRCQTRKSPLASATELVIPAIEGSGIPGTNPHEQPLKAGEFVLGYHG